MELKEQVKVGLQYYKESSKVQIDSLLKQDKKWNEKEVEIEGVVFNAKHTSTDYIMFVGERPVLVGAVDNEDFDATIENDEKTFGMVMKAMEELETKGEVGSYLDDEVELQKFMQQFLFVLGF